MGGIRPRHEARRRRTSSVTCALKARPDSIGTHSNVIGKYWKCDGDATHYPNAPEKPTRCPYAGCNGRLMVLANQVVAAAARAKELEEWKAERDEEKRLRLER